LEQTIPFDHKIALYFICQNWKGFPLLVSGISLYTLHSMTLANFGAGLKLIQ